MVSGGLPTGAVRSLRERGPQVAGRLTEWGQAVFAAVFGAGPARDAYVRARVGGDVEIVFRSSAPARLGLPWELLCDPARPTPVALDRVEMSRSLLAANSLRAFTVGGKRLRVLMVISRPQGTADVGYRMIARPLLERLEAVRGKVDLVVLRPPTLARLGEELSTARVAGEPFQIVHFDGHGVLAGGRAAPESGAPLTFEDPSAQGVLVFEKPGGEADQVPVAEVARVLAGAEVPLVVLKCLPVRGGGQGAGGRGRHPVVARLLQEGAASVVAMAYSVYAVAVSLLQGVADVQVLGSFSQMAEVSQRFRGCTTADWAAVLDQAASMGLLSPLGGGMYRIHPALPACLAQQWRREELDDYHQQRAAADAALLDAYAAFGVWLLQQIQVGDAAFAFEVLDRQRRTLGTLLGNALDRGRWDRAAAIAESLNEYWDAQGLLEEARGWVDRARLALETADGTPPELDDPGGALWLFFIGSQAIRQLRAHQLDAAERTYLDIRDMLLAQPESQQQRQPLAATYHQLGRVAQSRGRLEDAKRWFRQALTIKEDLGNRPGMATTYSQLGMVAHRRGCLEDAEDWFRQALTISEVLGDRPGMASSFGQLGLLAETRRRVEEALEWMVRCVTLFAEFPHPMTEPGPTHLARLTAEVGIETLERGWHRVTGQPLPQAVRDFIASGPAEDAEGMRE